MIYKFEELEDKNETLEVSGSLTAVFLEIVSGGETNTIALDKDQLYDLIGALHSIQSKLKEIQNGGK